MNNSLNLHATLEPSFTLQSDEPINARQFMDFFKDNERLGTLSPTDRVDVFKGILVGSADLTASLLQSVLADFGVNHIDIIDHTRFDLPVPRYVATDIDTYSCIVMDTLTATELCSCKDDNESSLPSSRRALSIAAAMNLLLSGV